MIVFCSECGKRERLSPDRWRCICGSPWEPLVSSGFSLAAIDTSDYSIWRYRDLFQLDFAEPRIRLGTGWTPIVRMPWHGHEVCFKLEFLAPTGSFKDRGTEVMINVLASQGVTHVVDDSSGNAGASVAAYAAKAGMVADVFVPGYASPEKQAQIRVYGAHVHPIPGKRADASQAALEAVKTGVALASHAYHPGFLAGQQSVAWEIWEQLGHRIPDWVVVPVGQGVHLLGLWLGFRRLRASGLTDRMPRLVGAQATAIAPLCRAFSAGFQSARGVEPSGSTVAEGLAISDPVRGRRLLEGLRETQGTCIAVEDDSILAAQHRLAGCGLYVEPTSATAVAALERLLPAIPRNETVVVPLTGTGLKGTPKAD